MKAALVAACLAATVSLTACGHSARYQRSTTQPTIAQTETGPAITAATTSTTAATTASGASTTTATVPLALQIGPNAVNYEPNPVFAPVLVRSKPVNVRGIMCQAARQLAYRRYAHLAIYVDGRERALPGGIGMISPRLQQTSTGPIFTASSCYYWLHTNTQDGVISVESPVSSTFTLGQFFAIWGQRLGRDQLGDRTGAVATFLDGHRWDGNPAAIPLREHTTIALSVGRPTRSGKAVDWTDSAL